MIDRLPLDLFGGDEPEPAAPAEVGVDAISTAESTPEPAIRQEVTSTCPWCAAVVPADARICPACEARIPVPEPGTLTHHDGICQWCGATISPAVDICPDCGWDARGENEIDMPGLTTPLSEEQIRSLYGGDDPEADVSDSIAFAAEIISLIVPSDSSRGR